MPKSSLYAFFQEHAVQPADHAGQKPGVVIADLSHWPKSEGYILEAGFVPKTSSSLWMLASEKFLAISSPDRKVEEFSSAAVLQTDVTSVYAHLFLAGRHVVDLLAKLTYLDLSVGQFANGTCLQGPVARLRCILFREDIQNVPAFHLLCSREYGVSLCEVLLHAGHEFSAALGSETARISELAGARA